MTLKFGTQILGIWPIEQIGAHKAKAVYQQDFFIAHTTHLSLATKILFSLVSFYT